MERFLIGGTLVLLLAVVVFEVFSPQEKLFSYTNSTHMVGMQSDGTYNGYSTNSEGTIIRNGMQGTFPAPLPIDPNATVGVTATATDTVNTALLPNADTQDITKPKNTNTNDMQLDSNQSANEQDVDTLSFTRMTLKTAYPASEISKKVGSANLATVLAINRLDVQNLRTGASVVIPSDFENPTLYTFMPQRIEGIEEVPKVVVVAQRIQAFGLYEYGMLIRSGPASSGKKDTPTKSGFYTANWKGKDVISTANDEWRLLWNVNIDNLNGIGIHQYALPGYPASHSCVRLLADDAEFLFNWVDQWSIDGNTVLATGTPVVIYGQYNFDASAPWKRLIKDPYATTVTNEERSEIATIILSHVEE